MTTDKRNRKNGQRYIAFIFTLIAAFGFSATAAQIPKKERTLYRSWVDHERYTGKSGYKPSTPTDYQQLAYELQTARAATRKTAGLSAGQNAPYETISVPRNNLRNRIPLSLIHWDRTLDAFTPAQQRQALSTGIAPEPIRTNVTVFAVSPVTPTTYRGASVEIALAADDLFEETASSNTIGSLRFDAGDGAGWHDLTIGQAVTASYDTIGTKTLTVEATLSDSTVLLATAPLEVASLSSPDPTQSVTLVADAPYNNTTGTIYILKSGYHVGLRCPVLVAEGFDMENNMDWDVLYAILDKQKLAENLASYGRDLVVLDYTNAMRNIFENAALARKAINYINANRNNASDKFTVIGASMGGLVTRIALADMDKNPTTYGTSHVNTWISFDSPHKGANIPLGLQEFFAFFQGKDFIPASVAHFYSLVNQPAARQMLLVHHSTTTTLAGNSSNVTFQAALDSKGYPTSCRKIAISNGSGYGYEQPFEEGSHIIHWDNPAEQWVFCDAACDIYAISTAHAEIFWGFHDTLMWFDETETTQYHYYPYSLDNAPGGYRGSFEELYAQIQASGNGGSGDFCNSSNHCFIPVVSSLGINMAYYDYPIKYYPSIKALSPFDEIHTASANEPHIDINYNNKRWFMRAILEGYDTDGDGFDDYKEYLLGTAYNSSSSKLEGVTIQTQDDGAGNFNLSWGWQPNVAYKVYFTENLAKEWTLVESGYTYQNWTPPYTASCQLPQSTPNGFYKIVSEVKDPVTD